jgi:hypothetical protein|tara:strand:+ start:1029 stop:1802 length:774 start_codon:yes stop_codon:yes gene_type:complete
LQADKSIKKALYLGMLAMLVLFSSCNKRFLGFKFSPREVLTIEEIDYEYISTRSKIRYKNQEDKTKATANIRIKRDSLIWFTLSNGVGIEGARGQITRDSVIILDRINRNIYAYSFEQLSEQFQFEFSYSLFQAIIIGDLPVPLSKNDDIVEKNNNFYVTQRVRDLRVSNMVSSKNRRLENVFATTLRNDNTLELKYGDFKPLEDKPFAYKALMILTYYQDGKKQEAEIDIEHNRVKIEDESLSFPFNIPDRYEKRQ